MNLRYHKFGNTYGGLNTTLASHVLGPGVSPNMDGFVDRTKGAEASMGWAKFSTQQLTDGAASPTASTVLLIQEFTKRDGTVYLMILTNDRAYYYDTTSTYFVPITPGTAVSTTVDQDSNSGTATLYVASTTGFTVGDTILINEGGAREEEAVVDSIAAGVSLGLLANLANTHTAAQADAVRRTYGAAIVDSDSASGQKVLSVSHTGQFTIGEEVVIGLGTARVELKIIDTISAGVSITFTEDLDNAHTAAQADKVYRLEELSFGLQPTAIDWCVDSDTFFWTDGANAVQQFTAVGAPAFSSNLSGLESGDSVEDIGTLTTALLAKCIRAFENFIVLGHTTEEGTVYPQRVRWCRRANYNSWVNAADGTGQAGYADFIGPEFVRRLEQLKRELLVYRQNQIEGMTYAGEPQLFVSRRVETGTGLIGLHALFDFHDEHLLLGEDNAYAANGMSVPRIGDSIWQSLFADVTDTYKEFCQNFYIQDENEILFIVPGGADSQKGTKAYVYSLLLRKWVGTRPVAGTAFGVYAAGDTETWAQSSGTWDAQTGPWDSTTRKLLMGDDSGYIHTFDEAVDKDGSAWTRTYYTARTDCGDDTISKRGMEVRLGLRREASGSINVYLGYADNEGDDMSWSDAYSVALTGGVTGHAYFDHSGKFLQVRVESTGKCNIRSIEVGYIPQEDIE